MRGSNHIRTFMLLAALTALFVGVGYLIGGPTGMLIAFGIAMVAFVIVGATFFQFVAMAILFLLMMAFEAINTAIEEIVDRVSPEISEMGKNAKDLGSFACLCLIIANAVYAGYVVIFDGFMN